MSLLTFIGKQGLISFDFNYSVNTNSEYDEEIKAFVNIIPALENQYPQQGKMAVNLDKNNKTVYSLSSEEIFSLYALVDNVFVGNSVDIVRENKSLKFTLLQSTKNNNMPNQFMQQNQVEDMLNAFVLLANYNYVNKNGTKLKGTIPIHFRSFKYQYMKAVDFVFNLRLQNTIKVKEVVNKENNSNFNNQMQQQGFVQQQQTNPFLNQVFSATQQFR